MKKLWLVLAVAFLAVSLAASGALAAQLSLTESHGVTTSLIGGSGAVNPSSGYISSSVYGYAYYNPSESPAGDYNYQDLSFGTPIGSSSSIPGMTWLQTTSSSVAYDGGAKFTMNQTYVGNAPNSSAPNAYDGFLEQSNSYYYSNYFSVTYTVPTAGDYTATVADLYNSVFKLVNANGGTNDFFQTQGYSYLDVYVNSDTGYGYLDKLVLNDYKNNNPNAVPDFTISKLGKNAAISFDLDDLTVGSTVNFSGYLYTYQEGWSNTAVPLPPTVLLLGTGLVGLVGLGWRRRKES